MSETDFINYNNETKKIIEKFRDEQREIKERGKEHQKIKVDDTIEMTSINNETLMSNVLCFILGFVLTLVLYGFRNIGNALMLNVLLILIYNIIFKQRENTIKNLYGNIITKLFST